MNKRSMILGLCFLSSIGLSQNDTQSPITEPVTQKLPEVDVKQAQQDMQKAYKKEFSFLTEQVKNIRLRTAEFKKNSQQDQNTINNEISQLENTIISLEKADNQYQDDIFEINRNSETATDNTNLLDATITQAQSTLSEFNIEAFADNSPLTDIEKMSFLIKNASKVLHEHSSITQTQGSFYLQTGQEVNGTVLKVGNIASYGHSGQGGGALAPAGDAKFKVWRDSDSQISANFIQGETADVMPIFLYESSIKSIDEKQDKTVKGVIDSGGIIAWIIVFLGLFALVLIVLRIWFLKSASSSTEKILNKVVYNIEENDLDHAIKIASYKKSSSARILQAVLRNITKDREHIEDIVSESILHESAQLNRFGSLIMVVATVSPLLGLLGTVTGMISTFDIITEFGTGDPKLLSSGISVALVTTEVGLAVAIPTLIFGNVLSGWAEKIKDEMEKAALRVINVYKKTMN